MAQISKSYVFNVQDTGPLRYVRSDGNDANSGTADTPSGAWKTLQKAANSVQSGYTVIVRAGTYTGFSITTSGTTFRADPGVIINQISPISVNSGVENGIAIGWGTTVPNNVTIEGFTFNPTGVVWYAAIRAAGKQTTRQNSVKLLSNTCNMRATDKYALYCAWQDFTLVENNSISGTFNSAIYIANSCNDYTVRSNTVQNTGGNGIHNNGDGTAGSPGISRRALIERNRIINTGGVNGGQAISCDGLQDSRIQNNLLIDNRAKGFSLYVTNGSDGSKNNIICNNTIIHGTNATGAAFRLPGGNTGNFVFNNIWLARNTNINVDGHYSYAVETNSTFDYNGVTDPVQRQISLTSWHNNGNDTHGVLLTGDLFIDPANGDYRPKPGGPLFNTGIANFGGKTAPTNDLDGNQRIGTHIGCY
jgi:hypothetical protein